MEKNELIEKIMEKAFNELESHEQPLELIQIYFSQRQGDEILPENEFTYLGWRDIHKEITPERAKELLGNLIGLSLEQFGKVLIYTCKDNALISIENIPGDEEMIYFDQDAEIKELYWAWD